jgi:hypothetical protein
LGRQPEERQLVVTVSTEAEGRGEDTADWEDSVNAEDRGEDTTDWEDSVNCRVWISDSLTSAIDVIPYM